MAKLVQPCDPSVMERACFGILCFGLLICATGIVVLSVAVVILGVIITGAALGYFWLLNWPGVDNP